MGWKPESEVTQLIFVRQLLPFVPSTIIVRQREIVLLFVPHRGFFFTFYFTVLLAFRSPLPFVSVWLIKLRNRCRINFGMAMFNSLTKRELSKLSTNLF